MPSRSFNKNLYQNDGVGVRVVTDARNGGVVVQLNGCTVAFACAGSWKILQSTGGGTNHWVDLAVLFPKTGGVA